MRATLRGARWWAAGSVVAAILVAVPLGVEARPGSRPARGKASTPPKQADRERQPQPPRARIRNPRARAATAEALRRLRRQHPYTARHGRRVAGHARAIARELGLSSASVQRAWLAGTVHDTGKIEVDRVVLDAPGKPSPAGRAQLRRHPEAGTRILSDIWPGLPPEIAEAVLGHHERWDGGGYPRGLRGRTIPLLARIIAVADAYDAMTSQRSYNRPLTRDQAVGRLREQAGRQFDPKVVEAFVRVLERKPER